MNSKRLLAANESAKSPFAEAFRMLRTNIQYAKVDREIKTVMITSSLAGEGKSSSASNTALALAKTGKRVVVLDCDLRRPVQHLLFGRTAIGLTNVLLGEVSIAEAIQETDIENLRLLASGAIPPNPSELLNSVKMNEVLHYLRGQADYIIVDTPPVLPVTDACVLAPRIDAVILVLGYGIVKLDVAREAKSALEKVQANIIGVTVNRVPLDEEHYYYGYYPQQEAPK